MRAGCAELRENETWLRLREAVIGRLAPWLGWLAVSRCTCTTRAEARARRRHYDTYNNNGITTETPAIMKYKTHIQRFPTNAGLCSPNPVTRIPSYV